MGAPGGGGGTGLAIACGNLGPKPSSAKGPATNRAPERSTLAQAPSCHTSSEVSPFGPTSSSFLEPPAPAGSVNRSTIGPAWPPSTIPGSAVNGRHPRTCSLRTAAAGTDPSASAIGPTPTTSVDPAGRSEDPFTASDGLHSRVQPAATA